MHTMSWLCVLLTLGGAPVRAEEPPSAGPSIARSTRAQTADEPPTNEPALDAQPAIGEPPDARPVGKEPTLAEVRRATLRYAGLDARPERSWARRTRWAGLLPQLTMRVSRDLGRDEGLSRASSGTERLDVGSDEDLSLEFKAVWQLDRLVFDDLEMRAAQIAQTQHRERLRLLAQVTSLYYQRRKLLLPPATAEKPGEAQARAVALEELCAQLDALTGGFYARARGGCGHR
ncbi:hypothetical protein [Haliangium sp.]|uniref:hypothetical protein n=1 Tax=Haliangium sp. TaxID=2663208 RepID=UPI003D096F1F